MACSVRCRSPRAAAWPLPARPDSSLRPAGAKSLDGARRSAAAHVERRLLGLHHARVRPREHLQPLEDGDRGLHRFERPHPVRGGAVGDVRLPLRELDPRPRDRQRIPQLVRHEAGERG